jgi:hypothetical protein
MAIDPVRTYTTPGVSYVIPRPSDRKKVYSHSDDNFGWFILVVIIFALALIVSGLLLFPHS